MSACRRCKRKLKQGTICRRCAAWAVRGASPLAGKKACVWIERQGAGIRVEDVPASQAAAVLADMLSAMRELASHFDELVPDLAPVPGGSPVDGNADEFGAHRVGFQTKR